MANPLEYAGSIYDPTTGLYDMRARFYDPASQGAHRFLSRDPLDGGYAYVGDSPANFVDPSGWMRAAPRSGGGSGGPSGTYTSAYCDSWAVTAGICIPDSNAPDATMTTTSKGGAGGGGPSPSPSPTVHIWCGGWSDWWLPWNTLSTEMTVIQELEGLGGQAEADVNTLIAGLVGATIVNLTISFLDLGATALAQLLIDGVFLFNLDQTCIYYQSIYGS